MSGRNFGMTTSPSSQKAEGTPRTSVVVAAYNEEAHICRLLRSLRDQTLSPIETIVVDDGSTDATATLAKGEGAYVISTSHRGAARARNTGAAAATGEFLVFIDGDMCAGPHYVERLVAPIKAGLAIGSFTKELYIGNPDSPWARCYARIRRLAFPRLLPPEFPDRWANYRAIRRDAFQAAGGYDDVGYGEDMTLAPKVRELAVAAPGAWCLHFNPASLGEIFENGRWIGRGYDIAKVARPWRDNSPWRAVSKAVRERDLGWRIFAARLAYHSGVMVGLAGRRRNPRRHWK
jgi:glycosyltransferase involved in cell wall biosynthesis